MHVQRVHLNCRDCGALLADLALTGPDHPSRSLVSTGPCPLCDGMGSGEVEVFGCFHVGRGWELVGGVRVETSFMGKPVLDGIKVVLGMQKLESVLAATAA